MDFNDDIHPCIDIKIRQRPCNKGIYSDVRRNRNVEAHSRIIQLFTPFESGDIEDRLSSIENFTFDKELLQLIKSCLLKDSKISNLNVVACGSVDSGKSHTLGTYDKLEPMNEGIIIKAIKHIQKYNQILSAKYGAVNEAYKDIFKLTVMNKTFYKFNYFYWKAFVIGKWKESN